MYLKQKGECACHLYKKYFQHNDFVKNFHSSFIAWSNLFLCSSFYQEICVLNCWLIFKLLYVYLLCPLSLIVIMCKSRDKSTPNKMMKVIILTVQNMKFSMSDFFSKCHQIWSFVRIRLHLLKKFLREHFFKQ